MTTIQTKSGRKQARWENYQHEAHWRSAADEFDAAKLGMWLFLTTEVLLFAGIFCAYAMFRMLYPEAFAIGSGYLDVKFGLLNTVVLLISSFTVAMAVRCAQKNQQFWLRTNLYITLVCAGLFLLIKFLFEYTPKWSGYFFFLDPTLGHYEKSGQTALWGMFHFVEGYGGKRPGAFFDYPFAQHYAEPLWWAVYYGGTAIHALHVVIGAGLLTWVLVRSYKGIYGPKNYTMVETSGLYWHLVDLVWIFLFPLLYLIG